MDDADLYYTESSIHALRGETDAALESLQTAYERGFRAVWMLELDIRLESLHQEFDVSNIPYRLVRNAAVLSDADQAGMLVIGEGVSLREDLRVMRRDDRRRQH